MNILRTVIVALLVAVAAPAMAYNLNGEHTWGTKAQIEAINKGIDERVERDAKEIAALKLKWQKNGMLGHQHGNTEESK